MKNKLNYKRGTSFMEALFIIVIVGVVFAITYPQFREMLYKSREARTKSALGQLRGAIEIYYSDNFGLYPLDSGTPETRLVSDLTPKYLPQIPFVDLVHYHSTQLNTVENKITGVGNWYYTTLNGEVTVNSIYLDTKQTPISSW
ncbi:MAG: type II secretion system protein [Elusimicrobiota bacterium]